MDEVKISCEFEVRFAWWLRMYVWGIVFVASTFRLEPDWQKVERVVKRAIRLRVVDRSRSKQS